MRAYLSFNLPEDQEEFAQAQRAGRAESVIDSLFGLIRSKTKYEDKTTIDLDELRAWLVNECDEMGIK